MPGKAGRAAAAALLLAAAALYTVSPTVQHARRPGQAHNPLELWNVAGVGLNLAASQHVRGGPAIACNVSSFAGEAAWVTVHWSGLDKGRFDDYIALYPAGADPRSSAPIKYHWAAKAPSHVRVGAGSLTFRLLNMRQDLRFALVRNGLQFPTIAAWSELVRVENPNQPMQGHLTLTGVPGEMRVQWATRDRGSPRVRWGTRSGELDQEAAGDSLTYSRGDMCGAPANTTGWFEPGWLHGAVMAGLQPSTRYFYRYGDEELGWSAERSFVSPPAPGPDSTVRLLAIADLGQAEVDGSMEASETIPSLATTARLAVDAAAWGAQLLVHNGDISYARGFGSIWDAFFDQLGPAAQRMPWMTTVGNHERDWPGSGDRFPAQYDSGGECGVAYYRRTRMPAPAEGQPWYSFEFGPIAFIHYSTEHLFEPGSPQHAWFEGALRAVNRSRTPWLVVGGHRPIYIDSTWWGDAPDGDQYVAGRLRDSLEELMWRYQVDVTWHGHHHSYQRTCPVFKERCVAAAADGSAQAPTHLVIGHAGAGLTPNVHFFRPRVFQKVQLQHGYLRVEANATHMTHQALSSFGGSLMDQFVLTKPPGWRFQPRGPSGPAADAATPGAGGVSGRGLQRGRSPAGAVAGAAEA